MNEALISINHHLERAKGELERMNLTADQRQQIVISEIVALIEELEQGKVTELERISQ